MKVEVTDLEDVLVLTPNVYEDDRGFFLESFNSREFKLVTGVDLDFVQDNHSKSQKGVLRGLHYQYKHPQGKLVRVVRGSVFDVAVDLRRISSTFGQWYGIELSEENKKQMWIPPGFAHGFLALSEFSEFLYKTTEFYQPSDEKCIVWDDLDLDINWPSDISVIISEKDRNGSKFKEAKVYN